MLLIKITTGSAKTRGRTDRFKTTGPVTGATILRLINEAFHNPHRMPPPLLPVSAEPTQNQAQYPRREIGIALALRQNQESAVVGDHPKPSSPLPRAPANPALTRFKMQRRCTESQQRNPLAIHLRHIPHPLTDQNAALKIMLLLQVVVEPAQFLLAHQANRDPIQNAALISNIGQNHGARFQSGRNKVQSFFITQPIRGTPQTPDESALNTKALRGGNHDI